jgi:hypothetical protein
VTKLLVERWPQSRLRDLLPDGIASSHQALVIRSGAFRSPLLGFEAPPLDDTTA